MIAHVFVHCLRVVFPDYIANVLNVEAALNCHEIKRPHTSLQFAPMLQKNCLWRKEAFF
jgi:hypothetical protein